MLSEWLPKPDVEWSLLSAAVVFFALMIGHALADFPLQGEFLSVAKNRRYQPPADKKFFPVTPRLWIYCMTVHTLVQAGAVWVITSSVLLGFIEFVVHWLIDFVKCEGSTGFEFDQWLHIGTKVVYVILIWQGLASFN